MVDESGGARQELTKRGVVGVDHPIRKLVGHVLGIARDQDPAPAQAGAPRPATRSTDTPDEFPAELLMSLNMDTADNLEFSSARINDITIRQVMQALAGACRYTGWRSQG